MMMKTVKATTLIATRIALTRADSVVPTISRAVTSRATTMAGMLTIPAEKSGVGMKPFIDQVGPADRRSGKSNPSPCSISPSTYPDQPTDTAEAATAYSRISAQPTVQASSSPITA